MNISMTTSQKQVAGAVSDHDCLWEEVGSFFDSHYETSCGRTICDFSPDGDDKFLYCPFCRKPIKVMRVKYVQREEDKAIADVTQGVSNG